MEHAGDLAEYLRQAAQAVSIHIDSQQSAQFIQYAQALRDWNRTINLTSVDDFREVVIKHFIDSIAPLQFGLLANQESLLDIGSGAGFPSIPLKIMRSRLRPILLEPNSKKSSFLLYLIGVLQLRNVRVVSQTLEQFANTAADRVDHVLIRALSQDTWGGRVAGLLSSGGSALAYRSTGMEPEDIPQGMSLLNEWSYDLPLGYGHRVLTALRKKSS